MRGFGRLSQLSSLVSHSMPSAISSRNVGSLALKKPKMDSREYRLVTLDNSLQALLISDPKADKAAAALDVHVGSLFDPKQFQGLAHFLEHMLFLGTEKYPDEEDYNKFLAMHGGASNAFTADTDTCYYFSVAHQHLDGALDRFAQFFVSPLFTSSATEREVQAVDSEHSKNLQSDLWRSMQLERTVHLNPEHPASHFGTGNAQTLGQIPREELLDFYKKWYSANIMKLCVLGRESLDELETMVLSKFSAVENKNVSIPEGKDFGSPAFVNSLRGEGVGKVEEQVPLFLPSSSSAHHVSSAVFMVPIRDDHSVTFSWFMEEQRHLWKSKPGRYLGHLLGHEGEGSVLAELKKRDLANALSAGTSFDQAGSSIFKVSVSLTESAAVPSKIEESVTEVGKLLALYCGVLKAEGAVHWIWEEMARIEEMNFEFRPTTDPTSAAQSLAMTLQEPYPAEEMLRASHVLYEFEREKVESEVQKLALSNMNVKIASKVLTEKCKNTEKWYGTHYSHFPLSTALPSLYAEWQSVEKLSKEDLRTEAEKNGLALPEKNSFVPESLEVKTPASGEGEGPPRAALLDQRALLLHLQDSKFGLPKAVFALHWFSKFPSLSAKNTVLGELYQRCISEDLVEISYQAEMAGLKFKLAGSTVGLVLHMHGYCDKMQLLLEEVVSKMRGYSPKPSTFSLVHDSYLRSLRNAKVQRPPYQQAMELVSALTVSPHFSLEDRLKAAEDLSLEEVGEAGKKILGGEGSYLEGLVMGNMDSKEAVHSVEKVLSSGPPSSSEPSIPPRRVRDLSKASEESARRILVVKKGSNPQESNGAVVLSIQAGFTSSTVTCSSSEEIKQAGLCALFSQIVGQKFFDQLRTKQQLGYIVHAGMSSMERGRTIRFIVQSEKPVKEVKARIEEFLEALPDDLSKLSEEEIKKYRDGVVSQLTEKPKTLIEEFNRHWSEIDLRRFDFSRRDRLADFLGDEANWKENLMVLLEELSKAPRVYGIIGGSKDDSWEDLGAMTVEEAQLKLQNECCEWVETNRDFYSKEWENLQ